MDSDERAVYDYLKSWPKTYVSSREIARRAGGKRRFREEPQWANPVISRLLEQGMIETDGLGHYRVKAAAVEKKRTHKWVSPQMKKILEQSGKDFAEVINLPEDFYSTPTPSPNK